ncbi:NAD-dependent epimerase/dehydratase family protein [Nocardia seriolae]|uniref:NAD-dependent epimerase/dehydratase family protein n=1 Tax=Nocardia seriolae TaxID=37332 RepID=UPI000EF1D973|nr:NAD-dependent epimerase/dehydratase family protein [Nocardia seriolae]MTJ60176.1 NAD-dependent epimerase/dehydratase family protein [Nocardia seriolae]MTJ71773.1 NAD-dependent epimerase/dehydratase family protein [Nocardia seriolae]MTJ85172.1 NAD-dependent epimerase/dehydratase family protein [Nocardia seriolae]MTK29168.1 NAD-dependent epimerase/dehydratase family protein [Nocardia seriolae]MTK38108.1 NAD-dependent epimerase/dehydratase family protein [Nocardia seriolae]
MSVRVLVTGAAGYLGRALIPALAAAGHTLRRAVDRIDAIIRDSLVLDTSCDTRPRPRR